MLYLFDFWFSVCELIALHFWNKEGFMYEWKTIQCNCCSQIYDEEEKKKKRKLVFLLSFQTTWDSDRMFGGSNTFVYLLIKIIEQEPICCVSANKSMQMEKQIIQCVKLKPVHSQQ